MPEFLRNLTEHITKLWGNLSGSQRITLVAAPAMVIALLLVAVTLAGQPTWVPLGYDTDPERILEVQDYLRTSRYRFRTRDGLIEVPQRPGLGFALNEEVVARYRVPPH